MKKVILGIILTIAAFYVSSATLTQAQKDSLKSAILAESTIQSCVTNGDDGCVANWLNSESTFVVWRTRVSKDEYQTSTGPTTGTTFDWANAGGYISRSQGERDAWNTMFSVNGTVNPSKPNVISAFNDIFSGSGAGAASNRNLLLDLSKRKATQAEKILATGTGTSVSPGTMTFEGQIAVNDIYQIMGR